MRNGRAFLAGLAFGLGLVVSRMTSPARVTGFLDITGTWDPTLAFVMGGAIIPMAIAWRLVPGRKPLVGGDFPEPQEPRVSRNLVLGSTMFGAGWGLAGLCPGPAIASLSYGGVWHWVFAAAMLAGMALTPMLRVRLDRMVPAE